VILPPETVIVTLIVPYSLVDGAPANVPLFSPPVVGGLGAAVVFVGLAGRVVVFGRPGAVVLAVPLTEAAVEAVARSSGPSSASSASAGTPGPAATPLPASKATPWAAAGECVPSFPPTSSDVPMAVPSRAKAARRMGCLLELQNSNGSRWI
jgi:hypothetical protein